MSFIIQNQRSSFIPNSKDQCYLILLHFNCVDQITFSLNDRRFYIFTALKKLYRHRQCLCHSQQRRACWRCRRRWVWDWRKVLKNYLPRFSEHSLSKWLPFNRLISMICFSIELYFRLVFSHVHTMQKIMFEVSIFP